MGELPWPSQRLAPPRSKRGVPVWLWITAGVVALICCGVVASPVAYFFSLDPGKYDSAAFKATDVCNLLPSSLQAQVTGSAPGVAEPYSGHGISSTVLTQCEWRLNASDGTSSTVRLGVNIWSRVPFKSAVDGARWSYKVSLSNASGPSAPLTGLGDEGMGFNLSQNGNSTFEASLRDSNAVLEFETLTPKGDPPVKLTYASLADFNTWAQRVFKYTLMKLPT